MCDRVGGGGPHPVFGRLDGNPKTHPTCRYASYRPTALSPGTGEGINRVVS